MIFFKINIIIVLSFIIGCSNATSQELEQNKSKEVVIGENDITVEAEDYKVKLKVCSLKIPSRYKLVNFSHHQPNYLDKQADLNKSFSYHSISFLHKEVSREDWTTPNNLILAHEIGITNKKFLDINILTSKLQFISSKKISNITISRYKNSKLKGIDRSDARQLRNEELYKLNNTLIVNETDFSIIISETDGYIDEIYKMIEDCASQMSVEKKK